MADRFSPFWHRLLVNLTVPLALGGADGWARGSDPPPPQAPAPAPPPPTVATRLDEAKAVWSKLDEAVVECQTIRETAARIKALSYQRQQTAAYVASYRALEDRLWPGRNRNNQSLAEYREALDRRTSAAAVVADLDSQLVDLRLRNISPEHSRAVEAQIRERTEALNQSLRDLRSLIRAANPTLDRPDAAVTAANRFISRSERYLKALKR